MPDHILCHTSQNPASQTGETLTGKNNAISLGGVSHREDLRGHRAKGKVYFRWNAIEHSRCRHISQVFPGLVQACLNKVPNQGGATYPYEDAVTSTTCKSIT